MYLAKAFRSLGDLTRSRIGQVALGMVICAWLSSCVQPGPDRSYLIGTPCAVPCWQGITPGVTEDVAAQFIISNPNLVKQDSIVRGTSQSEVGYVFEFVSGDSGSIGSKNNIVYEIQIRTHNLTLGEIINALGPPDFVYAVRRPNEHSLYDYYEVQFFYPDKGLRVTGSECAGECDASYFSGDDVYIDTRMGTWMLSFFQPSGDLHTALTESLLLSPDGAENIVTNVVPWRGVGRYYKATKVSW